MDVLGKFTLVGIEFLSLPAQKQDVGTQTVGALGRMQTDNAIPDYHDFAMALAEDAARLYALAALRPCQIITADTGRHITGNGTHGGQQRISALSIFNSLIGNRGGTCL